MCLATVKPLEDILDGLFIGNSVLRLLVWIKFRLSYIYAIID